MRVQWMAVAVAALLTSACSLNKQEEPALMGPSDLGLSISLTATPDQLPRDGNSRAVVSLLARDPSNRPIVGQRLLLSLGTGSPVGAALSQQEVTTNAQGAATFSVSAPTSGSTGNSIVVVATPVGNNADNTRARILSISVNPPNSGAPTAAFTFSPATPEIGQVVTFDASTTTDEGVACNTCGFLWDFGGEGTAAGRVATHAFTAAGPYRVTLTATDSVGTSSQPVSQTVTVTAATIPSGLSVTSSPNPPVAKQSATFTASATAAANHRIVSYQFIWGDGDTNTSNSPVIQHAYSQSGNFLLTLTVRDDLNQSTTSNTVIAVSSGLTASFTVNPASPGVGVNATFDASASTSNVASTISTYAWDFNGDGITDTSGSTTTATYAYAASGTYTAKLTITDSRGVTQTATRAVVVP